MNTPREIKFRAWDKKEKKMWNSGFEMNGVSGERGVVSITTLDDKYEYTRTLFLPKEVVLMQYTGLKDWNKKSIWEGDMVEDDFGTKLEVEGWLKDYSLLMEIQYELRHVKVIGNIYENPELLK